MTGRKNPVLSASSRCLHVAMVLPMPHRAPGRPHAACAIPQRPSHQLNTACLHPSIRRHSLTTDSRPTLDAVRGVRDFRRGAPKNDTTIGPCAGRMTPAGLGDASSR